MKPDYLIEQYKETDQDAVMGLMQETFVAEKMRKAKVFSPDFWRWQYQENPFGCAVTILAKDNGNIIGQYVNIPLHLKFNCQMSESVLVIDLMVRDSYRGQGVFKKMGEVSNQRLSELSIPISFAFPSRYDSYAGFINKLGWFAVGDLKILVKPISPWIFNKEKSIKGIEIKKIFNFPEDIDSLWNNISSSLGISIIRNSKYLNWRYFQNPSEAYSVFLVYKNNSLVGYFVLKVMNLSNFKLGLIVDMLCLKEEDILQSIIFKATHLFLESKAYLYAILRTKFYESILKKWGFITLPYYLSPKNYTLIARINQKGIDLTTLKNIDNWYLTFGDWDVV